MKIIMLAGKKHSGKDTAAEVLLKLGVKRLAFADKLKKDYCKKIKISLNTLNNDKERYRNGLIDMAMDMRDEDPECLISPICKVLDKYQDTNQDIVITDCRFKNEFNIIKMLYKEVICVYVDRDLPDCTDDTEQFKKEWADYIIDSNQGIPYLQKQLLTIYKEL